LSCVYNSKAAIYENLCIRVVLVVIVVSCWFFSW